MSAWCDIWYETQDHQVACDSFSLNLSHVPQKILATQFEQQDAPGTGKLIPLGHFLEAQRMVTLDLNAPGFERIGQAFDNLHGFSSTSRSNTQTPAIISPVRTRIEQSLIAAIFNFASGVICRSIVSFAPAVMNPRLDPAPLLTKDDSHQSYITEATAPPEPPTDRLCFVIHKCTAKEKLKSLDKLKLSNYVRSFRVQWNDIDDILEGEVVGHENDLPIISRLLVKGKDWSWRWIPAECVDPYLIQTYLKGRAARPRTITEPSITSLSTEKGSKEDELVVYIVRQALRAGYPFRETGILNVARFLDLKQANKCAKRHFKTLCTKETVKKVRKYRFGDMFFGLVANNDWKDEDITIWVEKETRKIAAVEDAHRSFARAESSVDNVANTVVNPSSVETPSVIVSGACIGENEDEESPNGKPSLSERLRDGRDFSLLVNSMKPQTDTGTLSGSLRQRESLSPHQYFAQMEKRMDVIWWGWIKHWETKAVEKVVKEKLLQDIAVDSDSGEKATSEVSASVIPLEGEHEVENSGSSEDARGDDSHVALYNGKCPDIEKDQHYAMGGENDSEREMVFVVGESEDNGFSDDSDDGADFILTPSSSVVGNGSVVDEQEPEYDGFKENSEDDAKPILTPSSSVFGDQSVVAEDEGLSDESDEGAGLILTPTSSILGNNEYMD
ncbi:uncharacterized protein PAC_11829 [Phialocephala subalpina]|uniref:Uncharacterized protein n=1 Tax=Phialocephala subalpina TaxID=576137 RepID=A0A1L7XA93_9HELO|nr:uncharacterized protein PAC_11829 [Phialocephala subalpina]